MNQTLLQRAEGVFLEVLEAPADQRSVLLNRLCQGDNALREEVQSFLDHHDGTGAFLRTGDMHRAFEAGPVLPSTRIGEFTVLGVLGTGGMGVVYRAEQERPRRIVALKLMRQTSLHPGAILRFEHEAELLGRLQHPGIAQIFGAGVANIGFGAQPYFAMELIDGPSISEYVATHRLDTRKRLELMLKVCAAAEHAHTKGVIHRDLKPANILVGPDGEPKIVDFGIARASGADIEREAMNTKEGELLGTLAYMSPEQVSGDPSDLDTRTDVYALGVVLYQLISGRPARDLGSIPLESALRKIREEDPPLLGTIDRSLKGDIETIAARAMSRDRERRYQSAAALADEIKRFLQGEPIEARRDSAVYVLRRRLHRYRTLVAAACLAVIGLTAFAVYAWNESHHQAALVVQASNARADAQTALEQAKREAEAVRRSDYFNRIGFAQAAFAGGDSDRMVRLLNACPPDLRGWEWSYLQQFGDRSTAVVQCREQGLGGAALAAPAGRIATYRLGEAIDIWDTRTHAHLNRITPEGSTSGIAITPDGQRIAATTRTCIQLWDDQGHLLKRIDASPIAGGIDLSSDGQRMLLVGPRKSIRVLNAGDGTQAFEFNCRGNVVCARFTPDGAKIITSDDSALLALYDASTGAPLATYESRYGLFLSLAFSFDGKTLSTGGEDGTVRLWGFAKNFSQQMFFHMHDNKATASAISPSGKTLVGGGTDTTIKVLDIQKAEDTGTLTGHARTVVFIGFLSETELISTSHDGTLRWWDLARLSDGPSAKLDGTTRAAAFGPNGIIVSGEPGKLHRLEGTSLAVLPALGSCPDPVYRLRSSLSTIFSVDHGGAVRRWTSAGESVVLARHAGAAHDLALCEQRHWAVSVGSDGDLLVNDMDNGALIHCLPVHAAGNWGATAVACSPSGDRIVTAGADRKVRVWDTSNWSPLTELTGHAELVWSLVITSDGRTVASTGDDGSVLLWPITGGPPRGLVGHHGAVYSIAASADGTRLLTGGFDNTVRLWDTASGSELLTLRGHTSSVWSVGFSPAGDSVLSCSDNGTVRLWRAHPEMPRR